MREITIDTPQGIGDLIWVYRKLSLYYDKINVNVLVVEHSPVQERSKDFLKTLDRIGEINFKKVSCRDYDRVAKGFYKVGDIRQEYSVNAWLEQGTHIDSIDNYNVNWDINLKVGKPCIDKEYILLYISGCNHNYRNYQMRPKEWADIAVSVCNKIGIGKCVLIGAQYDKEMLSSINKAIANRIKTIVATNYSIQDTSGVIAGSTYFISYQSGLCMIAEELSVPTLMVYFPENRKMVSAWIRKNNLEIGLFKSVFFGEPVEYITQAAFNHIKGHFGRCDVN